MDLWLISIVGALAIALLGLIPRRPRALILASVFGALIAAAAVFFEAIQFGPRTDVESGLAGPHVPMPSWVLHHDSFALVLAMIGGALVADLVVLVCLLAFDWARHSFRRLSKQQLIS